MCQTLRADQHQRQLGGVPEVGQPVVVVIDGLEADLVLQTEDEDDGVHPQRKLRTKSKLDWFMHQLQRNAVFKQEV